jgi:hypothetical protein
MPRKYIVTVIVQDNEQEHVIDKSEDTSDNMRQLITEALINHEIGFECLEVKEQ